MRRIDIKPYMYLTLSFIALLMIITILFMSRIEKPYYPIMVYIFVAVLQILRPPVKGWDIAMPFISVVLIFDSLGYVVHPVNPRDIDPLLLRIDYMLTGTYPTVSLQKIINPFLTEIMQLAYTSYYFIPVILGISLKIKKKEAEFEKALFLVLFCFYLSYIGYILFPALGPRFYIGHLHTVELKGLFLMEPIHELLNKLEGIKRDAFPSGHTAIALLCLIISFKSERKLFWYFLPVVVMLMFSTVYLRYHYVIDVIAGIILTMIVLISGPLLYRLMKGYEASHTDN